jgi:disulfide bond formation protein DsbB
MLLGCLAFLVALIGVAGSLYLSIGMELRACPLCFYQRTFVMGVFAVLGVGLLADRQRIGLLFLLSVPLTVGGIVVAGFHEYLVLSGTLECPDGIYGLGSSPAQSLALFVILTAIVLFGAFQGRHFVTLGLGSIVGAAVLGALLGYACIASSPPLPAAPTKPYADALVTCRPPCRGE